MVQPEESIRRSAVRSFADFCTEKKVQVFHFKKLDDLNFEIVPYIDSASTEVEMVTFIYELNELKI